MFQYAYFLWSIATWSSWWKEPILKYTWCFKFLSVMYWVACMVTFNLLGRHMLLAENNTNLSSKKLNVSTIHSMMHSWLQYLIPEVWLWLGPNRTQLRWTWEIRSSIESKAITTDLNARSNATFFAKHFHSTGCDQEIERGTCLLQNLLWLYILVMRMGQWPSRGPTTAHSA
jgi:hypothetical protein